MNQKPIKYLLVIPVIPLLIGIIVTTIVGLFAIKLIHIIIQKNYLRYFGLYCIALGFIVTVIGAVEVFVK